MKKQISLSVVSKSCQKCNQEKQAEAFSKNAKSKDGLCVWCKSCSSEQQKQWRLINKEKLKENDRARYVEQKERVKSSQSAYRADNKAAIKRKQSEKYQRNNGKYNAYSAERRRMYPQKYAEYERTWRSRNTHVVNAASSMRRAALLRATPAWADMNSIKSIFLSAAIATKETCVPHDVDHIVPIKSPLVQSLDSGNLQPKRTFIGPLIPVVQGLHCESNLRVITESENARKSNVIWPDMPNISI